MIRAYKKGGKTSILWTSPRELFCKVIDSATSLFEILYKFGLKGTHGNYNTLKERLVKENLSVDDIIEKTRIKRRSGVCKCTRVIPLIDLLTNIPRYPVYSADDLKRRLIKECLLENKCSKCGQGPIWNGEKLTLQIDHINGVTTDNRLENLRILCPNCHTQTKTYGGRNRSKKQQLKAWKRLKCKNCLSDVSVYSKSGLCRACADKIRIRKIKFVCTKERLSELVKIKPIEQIGKQFGVSGNAVLRWMKKYGIPKVFKVGEWAKKTLTKQPPPKEELLIRIRKDTLKNVSKAYAVSEKIMARWLRQHGLTKTPELGTEPSVNSFGMGRLELPVATL